MFIYTTAHSTHNNKRTQWFLLQQTKLSASTYI